MAVSATARVNVLAAANAGDPIPEGWAIDPDGNPTTDPALAIAGTVAPAAGYKGYALALIVDVLAAGLTGASWSIDAGPMLDDSGGPPDVGQLFVAFSPSRLGADRYADRLESMVTELLSESGVRLPGDRRHQFREQAEHNAVEVPAALLSEVRAYTLP